MGGARYLLRLRYAEHFGALLSARHFGRLLPIAVASPALLLIFAVNFASDLLADRSERLALGGFVVAMMLLFSIHFLRVLLGYALRHRFKVSDSLADKIRPEEDWPGSRMASSRGTLWLIAVGVWLVALVALAAVVSGDLTPE